MGSRVCPAGRFASTDYASYSHINSYPGGMMCFISVTSNTGSFTTEATLTGFDTGDITVLPNRLYRVRYEVALQSSGTGQVRFWLTDRDNNHLTYTELKVPDSDAYTVNMNPGKCGTVFLHSPPGGTYGYKVRGVRLVGSGTTIAANSSTLIGYIMVDDVGPSI